MNNLFENLKLVINKEKKNKEENPSKDVLLKEIRSVMADIACADTWFEFEEDSDMLESCIYYIESLKARYRYLLKKAKINNIVVSFQ